MLPMKALRLQVGEALANDTTFLNQAADNLEVALIVEAFAEDEELAIDDLVLADFNGSTPKLAGLDEPTVGIDPITGEQVITIKEPAGGWRWECGADPAEPQTVFGYCLTTKDQAALLAVKAFNEPLTISEAGEEINLGSVTMRVNVLPLS